MQRRRALLPFWMSLVLLVSAPALAQPSEQTPDATAGEAESDDGAPDETGVDHEAGVPVEDAEGDAPPDGVPNDAASDDDASEDTSEESASGEDAQQPDSAGSEPSPLSERAFPKDPLERLRLAREAFRDTEYALLVPLLGSLTGADTPFDRTADRVEARELLAVGYFFQAQQATGAAERDALLDRARAVFLDLLRDKPDHTLDNLVFPASVVDLFDQVREENADELEALLADQNDVGVGGELQTIYIERAATQRIWWVNLLPFGAGQIQNGQVAKATAFALLQGAGLAVNGAAYYVILSLRNPQTGRYEPADGGTNSNFASALRWRQVLYGGLIGFGVVWTLSIIDGFVNFEPENVRIRTLDAPPPELEGVSSDAGLSGGLPLGLSVEWIW